MARDVAATIRHLEEQLSSKWSSLQPGDLLAVQVLGVLRLGQIADSLKVANANLGEIRSSLAALEQKTK